jgi:iron complex outermembrane receptor protein
LFTLSLRDRQIKALYGDGVSADFGLAGLNDVIDPPRPNFSFGPLTNDQIKQATAGLSYGLNWQHVGELTLGIQYTDYIKNVTAPGTAEAHRENKVWLPSISTAKPLTKQVSLYGSYVQGVEDAGAAPGYASNAGQVLPANRTHQWDAGLKWTIDENTTLIAGYFYVTKPYITLSKSDYYGQLGTEIHKGLEISLTATPVKDLKIIVGGIVESPRVEASSDMASLIGKRPVGQPNTTIQLNLSYTLPFAKAVTLDVSVNNQSSQAGTDDNVIVIPGSTNFGLGARYQFKLGGKQCELRVSGDNLGNVYRLTPLSSGVYAYNSQRSGTV